MPVITAPYKVLREKLGDDVADALVELIHQAGGPVNPRVLAVLRAKLGKEVTDALVGFITQAVARPWQTE